MALATWECFKPGFWKSDDRPLEAVQSRWRTNLNKKNMYIICLPRPVFEPGSTQNIPSTLADHAQKVSFVFSDTTELCEWHLNNSKSGLMILVWSPIK